MGRTCFSRYFLLFLSMALVIPAAEAETVSFIALGDFGTGDIRQIQVAKAMEVTCSELRKCDFVVGLGDNIYEKGVTSITDERFLTHFEQPYANLSMPFFMTLGNHDDISLARFPDTESSKGNFQVQYHYREDRPSNKWQMPARYYHFTAPLTEKNTASPHVDFLALDASPIAASLRETAAFISAQDSANEQVNWLVNTLPNLEGRWRVAFSHYPYISNGRHGNAGNYDNNPEQGLLWKEFVEKQLCDKVHLLLSGHDHSLQLLDPVADCGETQFVVSGSGGKLDKALGAPTRNKASWQEAALGFFWIEMDDSRMTIEAWIVQENSQPSQAFSKTVDYFPLAQ